MFVCLFVCLFIYLGPVFLCLFVDHRIIDYRCMCVNNNNNNNNIHSIFTVNKNWLRTKIHKNYNFILQYNCKI